MPSIILWSDIDNILRVNLAVLAADMTSGEILFATRAAEVMFGYTVLGELVGKNVDDLVPSERKAAHSQHRSVYAADPKLRPMGSNLPLHGLRRDGTVFPIAVALIPAMLGTNRSVVAVLTELPQTAVERKTS